jgi:zinc-binding alcohol dehydrogenase/oxidoreductase
MKAAVLLAPNQLLDYQEVERPRPARGEVVVDLLHAALNHRDLWITLGQYAGIRYPMVLGSDGAGTYRGRAYLLNPSMDWGDDPRAQGKNYRILGLPDYGTFAEAVCVPRANLVAQPTHLTSAQAAALPLAGLTAWRVLMARCQLRRGERVLISGVGGGVALLALQMAVAAGAEVWVTSGSDEKIARAVALGARGGANYRHEGWDKTLRSDAGGGFDVVIDSAAGDGFATLVNLCLPGARVGIYGGTLGKINGLSPQLIFWKQISIVGSTMGHAQDFRRMVAFVAKHEIVPVVDSEFGLSEANLALQRIQAGTQFGKIVLRCTT